jgi:hypothetical protein
MISIPTIEKPSDKLTKLIRVEIFCSVWLMVFSYQSKARSSGYIRRACVDDRKWNKRPSACPRDSDSHTSPRERLSSNPIQSVLDGRNDHEKTGGRRSRRKRSGRT